MSTTRPRRRPGENRSRLLSAGVHEFGLLGYAGTSTSRITSRAEVPQPHLYASFSTKQALFLACIAHTADAIIDSAPDMPAEGHLRLFYQAVGSSGVSELQPELAIELTRIQEATSDEFRQRLLTNAAASLLAFPGQLTD